jgi:hypothetical protein
VKIGRIGPVGTLARREPFERGQQGPFASGTCCQATAYRVSRVRHGER